MAKVYNIFGQDLTLEQLRTVNFSKSTVSDLFEVQKALNPVAMFLLVKDSAKEICHIDNIEDLDIYINKLKAYIEAYIKFEYKE